MDFFEKAILIAKFFGKNHLIYWKILLVILSIYELLLLKIFIVSYTKS